MQGDYDPLDPYGVNTPPDPNPQPPAPAPRTPDKGVIDRFRQHMSAQGIPNTWGNPDDAEPIYQGYLAQGMDPDAAFNASLTYLGWQKGPAGPAAPATNSGGGPQPVTNGTLGDLLKPISSSFQAPTPVNLGGPPGIPYVGPVPEFHAPTRKPIPTLTAPDPFKATTAADVMADPSYEFTRKQGEQALINDQAAKGARRSGNSLMDLTRFNQDYAGTRYGDIDNRRRADYNTGVSNNFHTWEDNLGALFGEGDRQFSDAMAEYQPKFAEWGTRSSAGQRQSELDWTHAFDLSNQQFDLDKFNKQFPYTVLSDQQRIGFQAASS